jgi:hypothetical protein
MGIIRILLLASFIAGTLAFHIWSRQPESQVEIIHSSPGSSKGFDLTSLFGIRRGLMPPQLKTKQTTGSWNSMEDLLEILCQQNDPYCWSRYHGVMFPSSFWPCGRKCY